MQEEVEMEDAHTEELLRRYHELTGKLASIGPIVQGTITERVITRKEKKGDQAKKLYGPYYQWTFKKAGKTVTVNLTPIQAEVFREAIDNNRVLEQILRCMRSLSQRICEVSTEGVKKRRRRRSAQNVLS